MKMQIGKICSKTSAKVDSIVKWQKDSTLIEMVKRNWLGETSELRETGRAIQSVHVAVNFLDLEGISDSLTLRQLITRPLYWERYCIAREKEINDCIQDSEDFSKREKESITENKRVWPEFVIMVENEHCKGK